jgi:hypothetical protein
MAGAQRMVEKVAGAREARVCGIHGGGGNAGETKRAGRVLDLARQRMRRVRLLRTLCRRGNIDENAAVLDLDGVGGNAILLEAGLAEPAAAVKLPIVPGADDVFAIEAPVAQGPARMIARVRDHAESSIPERDRDLATPCGGALKRCLGKVRGSADIDPVFICHGDPSLDATGSALGSASPG